MLVDTKDTRKKRYFNLHNKLNQLMHLHDPTFTFNAVQLTANVVSAEAEADVDEGAGVGKIKGKGIWKTKPTHAVLQSAGPDKV